MKVLLCVVLLLASTFAKQVNSDAYNPQRSAEYLMFAYGAYCNSDDLQSWSCYWCLNPAATHLTTTNFFEDKKTNTFGYAGVSSNEIIVSFRGTESDSLQNWITDLEFAKTSPYKNMPDVKVHDGFYKAYQTVEDAVRSAVSNLTARHPSFPVVVTGHSLGAALSTLCGADLAELFPQTEIIVWNFGDPRVGNQAWRDYYVGFKNIRTTYRVINQHDIVPAMPYEWMGFYHEPTEVWYQNDTIHYTVCNTSGEDPHCQDSLKVTLSIDDHLEYLGYDEGSGDDHDC
jgi:hypothetical protein